MIGWRFCEIGHIEKGHEIEGVLQVLKNAQYCEDCKRFIGRWISWANEKVWCTDCWDKKEVSEKKDGNRRE